jgi:hypothetical protein
MLSPLDGSAPVRWNSTIVICSMLFSVLSSLVEIEAAIEHSKHAPIPLPADAEMN